MSGATSLVRVVAGRTRVVRDSWYASSRVRLVRYPLAAFVVLGLAGCGPGTSSPGGRDPHDMGTEPDMRMGIVPSADTGPVEPPDSGLPPLPDPPGNRTLDYVLRIIRFGIEERPGITPGFNVDGLVTLTEDDPLGCRHIDATAPVRYGSTPGVDNRFGPLLQQIREIGADFDPETAFLRNIQSGSILLLVRLSGVADGAAMQNDGSVSVAVFLGRVPGGAMPRLEPVDDRGTLVMTLVPGQTFLVDPATVEDRDLTRPRIRMDSAEIRDGQLRAGPVLFPLQMPVGDAAMVDLDVHETQLIGNVSESALSVGMLGGYVANADVVENWMRLQAEFPDVSVPSSTVSALLRGEADIDLTDAFGCEGTSLAFTIEGVTAVIGGVAP